MVPYFIITGISDAPGLKILIFLLVLLIYLLTLGGNMTILVCLDRHLHNPMYFFLGNLSVLDMFTTTVTLHKVLTSFISGDKTVSLPDCFGQVYFFSSLTGCELSLLTAMSYDRYVAICKPLHYSMVMNRRLFILLATFCWNFGFIRTIPYLVLLSSYTCYISNIINHFYCDMVPFMKLICNNTSVLKTLVFTEGLFISILTPFFLTFISYIFIISTILKIRSSIGRHKAFYTCSSHLTVVILLYMTFICQYMKPTSMDNLDSNKLFSLFNTAAVPILNPLIYSLKNKDVKTALRRQLMLNN
ncbi:olfactory receptor 6C1-like [Discoglossus pictus]